MKSGLHTASDTESAEGDSTHSYFKRKQENAKSRRGAYFGQNLALSDATSSCGSSSSIDFEETNSIHMAE